LTTYLDADHGPLLKCDNDTILCSTEEWLVDGSVNMRIPAQATTSFSDIDHPSFGSLLCENRNELLQEHGSNILVGEELFYNDVTYA